MGEQDKFPWVALLLATVYWLAIPVTITVVSFAIIWAVKHL